MKGDLIERLRLFKDGTPGMVSASAHGKICNEAADEIELLRDALGSARFYVNKVAEGQAAEMAVAVARATLEAIDEALGEQQC